MSWSDADDARWDELGDDTDEVLPPRWPLNWRALYPRERWLWFERLWTDVCSLRERYSLPLRSGWWTRQIQVEALAALAAWVDRYDSGEWDDPPGKPAYPVVEHRAVVNPSLTGPVSSRIRSPS